MTHRAAGLLWALLGVTLPLWTTPIQANESTRESTVLPTPMVKEARPVGLTVDEVPRQDFQARTP
ncbi:MAG: hypothetical protein VX252_09770, partial [Myxococcota bacterium]|nr:hypothetical protein [Myxococcota bacterium]